MKKKPAAPKDIPVLTDIILLDDSDEDNQQASAEIFSHTPSPAPKAAEPSQPSEPEKTSFKPQEPPVLTTQASAPEKNSPQGKKQKNQNKAKQVLDQNEKMLEALIDEITTDVKNELSAQIEQAVRKSVEKAIRDAIDKSTAIMREAMLVQLSDNLSPIIELIIEDIEDEKGRN